MRIHEIIYPKQAINGCLPISEAPLPPDWDDAIYQPHIPFKKRVEYAKRMATKVGAGSSRIAFLIPYEGRETILKVAKNAKGVAQNKAEFSTLSDPEIMELDITIPCIDCDKTGWTWIQVEYAKKATVSAFKAECGVTPDDLVLYATQTNPKRYPSAHKRILRTEGDIEIYSPLTVGLIELANSDKIDIRDCSRIGNWGIFNGNIVIIDAGFNDDTRKLYS